MKWRKVIEFYFFYDMTPGFGSFAIKNQKNGQIPF